jgi:hypothetical protein
MSDLIIKISKEDVEGIINDTMTESQWDTMKALIDDLIEYYVEDECPRLWTDPDNFEQ